MTPLHSPTYAALLGGALLTLQMVLMLTAGAYRGRTRKSIGVAGDRTLERLVRRHGNLAENAAIFVIVLALYELMFGQTYLALGTASVFFAARLLHAFGFASDAGSHLVGADGAGSKFVLMRMAGAGLTAVSSLVLGCGLVLAIAVAK